MKRLQRIFTGGKALVIFDSCGAPDMTESEARLEEIIAHGADILELGIPFSDPMADGPVIQQASQQALRAGATLEKILDMAGRIRQRHMETGMIAFGYYNIFLQYGIPKLFRRLRELDIDGILIVDLPYEEREEVAPEAKKNGISLIPLIGPSTDIERAKMLTADADGFVYCINARGVTGARAQLPPELSERLDALRRVSPVPVAAGFGIADAASAAAVSRHADAVVVGSAAVRLSRPALGKFIRSLKNALI